MLSLYERYVPLTEEKPVQTLAATQEQIAARALAAYALNLMHGAVLADFERNNLIALAGNLGVATTERHLSMERGVIAAREYERDELNRLRANASLRPVPWWRALLTKVSR